MSEPRIKAGTVRAVLPGLLRWHVLDDRIGADSEAYAVRRGGSLILIDPLPLTRAAEASLARRGRVEAICLTGSCHQRSAWRLRRLLGARVLAPRGAEGLEEAPDGDYVPGPTLPGGLIAVHTPGPTEAHYSFLLPGRPAVLFCADLLINRGRGALSFIQAQYQDDPARTRQSVRGLLDRTFGAICCAHGAPITGGAAVVKKAIRDALRRDSGD